MKRLYDISAYDECGKETDPTRGEYILAASEEEAIKIAMEMAEEQGLKLHGFYVYYIEPTNIYFKSDENGFKIYDEADNEYIGYINIIDESDIDKLLMCKTLKEATAMFDDIVIVA